MVGVFNKTEVYATECGVNALQDLQKRTISQGKECPIDFKYFQDSMTVVVISRPENVTPMQAARDLVSLVELRVNKWNNETPPLNTTATLDTTSNVLTVQLQFNEFTGEYRHD